jgi:ParB-like chromosome segregation protein Spo0J
MMSDSELKELAADIKKNGQKEPVLFAFIAGVKTLIDGRNRCAALHILGRKPEEATASPAFGEHPKDVKAFILSKNVHRRHLTSGERADALQGFVRANQKKSDRALAEEAGVSPTTIGKVRSKLSTAGQLKEAKRVGKDNKARKVPAKKPPRGIKPGPKLPKALDGGADAQEAGGAAIADSKDSIGAMSDHGNAPPADSTEQRKAAASEGNTAGLDEFKECCARLFPTFDKVDLAEVRSYVDRECSKCAAALRSASVQ